MEEQKMKKLKNQSSWHHDHMQDLKGCHVEDVRWNE